MTSSTVSSESAPKSSTNEALGVTSPSSTPSCSEMICFTFSTAFASAMGYASYVFKGTTSLLVGGKGCKGRVPKGWPRIFADKRGYPQITEDLSAFIREIRG